MSELASESVSQMNLPDKVLVANRGEIAVRIMRTLRRLGIGSVAVYHAVDARSRHVRDADEAVELTGASPVAAYLDAEQIVAACRATGADAVHPGFGFLSERATFAETVTAAGVTFIGPPPDAIRAMGDKIESKRLAIVAGVPTLPGSEDALADVDEALTEAERIGYPVLLKASAGGGGKGMRIARSPDQCREAFERATGEAEASFGDGRVFVERYVDRPRHIEIQVLADAHGNVVHLGERECSIQRRYQKVIEEAPSPFVSHGLRAELRPQKANADLRTPEDPYYDPAELYGIIPDDIKKQFDMREVIARIVDGSMFHEFKPAYGDTLVRGWAYIWGIKVGILGNNGVLFSEAANKASQFMQLCDRDGTPLVFLHNVTGFMVGKEYERRGITKDGAKMLMVQANVTVPKISLLVHASQGAGNYAMAGRAWDPRFLFAWPNSRSATMGADQAVKTLTQVRVASMKRQGLEPDPDQLEQIQSEVGEYFERTSSPFHLTSELRDDGLIDPTDTRNTLGMALSASLCAPIVRTPGGVLRI